MRRLLLYLPTLLLGVPLLAILVAASNQTRQRFAAPTPAAPVVLTQEGALPDMAGMERLVRQDPCAFLENTLRLYQRDVKGYTCQLQKQEFIGGRLQPVEVTAICF